MESIKEYNLDVPNNLAGITLRQYQQWMKILKKYQDDKREDENYLKIKMLQVFCNLSIEDTYEIPLHAFDYVITHLTTLFDAEHQLIQRFPLKDASNKEYEFGMIPNLDKMSFGEYVDLDTYINDNDNLHKAMAVLFRPISNTIGTTYKIQKYKGSDKFSEAMKDIPVNIVLGAINFILRLQNELVKAIQVSSQKKVTVELEQALKQTSEESTVGFNQFILLLKKMQLKSMMQ